MSIGIAVFGQVTTTIAAGGSHEPAYGISRLQTYPTTMSFDEDGIAEFRQTNNCIVYSRCCLRCQAQIQDNHALLERENGLA